MNDTSRNGRPPPTKSDAIRLAYANGEGGYAVLAKRFGISKSTVMSYITDPRIRDPLWILCKRKQRHASEQEAMIALTKLIADTGGDYERECTVYKCDYCGGYHFGHPRKDAVMINLTARERQLILRALKTASENGLIYGSAETDDAMANVNYEVEVIEGKLR